MTASLVKENGLFVVLGASGGIGSAVTRHLFAQDHRVALAGRTRENLDSLAGLGEGLVCTIDATSFEDVADCFQKASQWGGRVHGVVSCVGSVLLKPAHLTSRDEFDKVIATNLTSAFAVVRAAAPLLRKEGGSIVLFSSAAAQIGLANHEAIAAAKAGVSGLAISAAATYAAQGIRVNAICPGLVATPLTQKLVENERMLDGSRALHPLGRIGCPDDIAPAVAWLLSPESSWVTGQIIGIDGGLASLKTRPARPR